MPIPQNLDLWIFCGLIIFDFFELCDAYYVASHFQNLNNKMFEVMTTVWNDLNKFETVWQGPDKVQGPDGQGPGSRQGPRMHVSPRNAQGGPETVQLFRVGLICQAGGTKFENIWIFA